MRRKFLPFSDRLNGGTIKAPMPAFIWQVTTLLKGTVGARLIAIVGAPLLTRIYDPESFAVLALFTSLVMMAIPLASLRYEMAIVIAPDDQQARSLIALCLRISSVISISLILLAIWKGKWLAVYLGVPELSPWLYLVGLNVFVNVYFAALSQWCIRKEYYRLVAASGIVVAMATLVFSIGLGVLFGINGLVGGVIIGNLSALLYLVYMLPNEEWKVGVYPADGFYTLKRYKKFPLFNMPNALLDGVRQGSINGMIGKFFGSTNLGLFSYAWRIVWLPLSLIGGSISQVFFQRMARRQERGEPVLGTIWALVWRLAAITAPFFFLIHQYAPELFRFIFGPEWEAAGHMAKKLIPWLYLNLLTSPLSTIFVVWERQEYLLGLSAIYLGTAIVTLYLTRGWADYVAMVGALSYSMSAVLLFMLSIVFWLAWDIDKNLVGGHE